MSTLNFTQSEIRLATLSLCAITAAIPAVYFVGTIWFSKPQETTPHVRTFRKYLKAYSTLRPQALIANASNDFTHTALPSSLQLPSRTLEPFKQHAAMVFSLFSSFDMIPQPSDSPWAVHFSAETNTCIAHCKMGGKVNVDSENGRKLIEQGITEWWTECVLMVRMSTDGRRVVEVREFVDGKKAEELKKRLTGVLES